MPPSMPNPPKKPANFGRWSKTLAFWVIVLLIPVAFLQFTSGGREQAPKISYTRYRTELERGNITKAVIQGGRVVVGDLATPVNVGTGRQVRKFTAQLPVADSEEEVKDLRARGVEIESQDARTSFSGVLVTFLP